jgi:hypothetical protein
LNVFTVKDLQLLEEQFTNSVVVIWNKGEDEGVDTIKPDL